jgi:nucleoside-diphosphate-sugar epimerase
MKKILVTGATGFIGGALSDRLIREGYNVQALVRNKGNTGFLAKEVRLISGDLFNRDALEHAMEGVEEVYHLAAYARPWAEDPATYFRINVEGADNVFKSAAKKGVRRVVFTSTAGVFGPSLDNPPVTEDMLRLTPIRTEYERSKAKAEALIQDLVKAGQDIVIVNPSRVYGPGQQTVSNGVTKMIRLYLAGKFRFYPGDGNSIGNYVFIDDVVNGHLLAMERGIAGERYALGGENASYRMFFEQLSKVSGVQNRMFPLPVSVLRVGAHLLKIRADWFGIAPLLTPEWVDRFMEHWALSTEKSKAMLGYKPVSLTEGLQRTVEWLRADV